MLSVEEISKRLSPIFEKGGVTKAILFGSYASGDATENSDVDIVIQTLPHIRGLKFYGIIGLVTDGLGKKVDLIPQRSIISGGKVDEEISRKGKVIYERQG